MATEFAPGYAPPIATAAARNGLYEMDAHGKVRLSLHYGQSLAWSSTRRILAIISGSQGGKTSFGPWWLWREIKRMGGGDYLAVTANYRLFSRKMLPELVEVFCKVLKVGRYWGIGLLELTEDLVPVDAGGRFWADRSVDPMWARIMLGAASSEGTLEAATAKAAWLDEAGQDGFGIGAWEAVMRRLSIAQGRVLITTTPYNLGWLKTEVYDRYVHGDSLYDVINFPSTMNPLFPQEELERARRTLPAWKFNMFYLGKFDLPAGLIFGDFDWDNQYIEPFPIPDHWERVIGTDFGGVNQAFVYGAIDPSTDRVYIYKESLEGGKTTREHAEGVLAALTYTGKDDEGNDKEFRRRYRCWGGAGSEGQSRRDFAAAGFHIIQPHIGEVEAGLDRVIERIKQGKLFLFKGRVPYLVDQMRTYSRKTDEAGNPTDEIKDKASYHMVDSLRYLCVGLTRKVSIS